jgi:hypothetical protein
MISSIVIIIDNSASLNPNTIGSSEEFLFKNISSKNKHDKNVTQTLLSVYYSSSSSQLSPESITPLAILRGETITASGRLVDTSSGDGIPNEVIKIFWGFFSWEEYETNQEALENTYLLAETLTDDSGDFFVTAADSSHSRSIGNVSVYTVFPGDPALGPIEENRQFTEEKVSCYGTLSLSLQTNTTHVRRTDTFWASSRLFFDNGTVFNQTIAEEVHFNWFETDYSIPFVNTIANETFTNPESVDPDTYEFTASFSVESLGLSYIVGDIGTSNQLNSLAVNWANNSIGITIFAGAGISISLSQPSPPEPGETPLIERENTQITISGTLTNSESEPFGYGIEVNVYLYRSVAVNYDYIQSNFITETDGTFTTNFQAEGNYLSIGVNYLWADVVEGQGITAECNVIQVLIVGNSSISSVVVNGTESPEELQVLPGEVLEITSTIQDDYNNDPVRNMYVFAQWEDVDPVFQSNTSTFGIASIMLQIPVSLSPTTPNCSVTVWTAATDYYTAADPVGFTVMTFTTASFTIRVNGTTVNEASTMNTIEGEDIYINSSILVQGELQDQFNRPIDEREVIITFCNDESSIGLDSGNFSYFWSPGGTPPEPELYEFLVVFNEISEFSFYIRLSDYPTTPPTTTTSETSNTTNGDNMFGTIMIWVSVTIVSLLIVVAVVYAFGRFRRKSGKESKPSADTEKYVNIDDIKKQIDEAEQAKDYQRGILLTYRVFEVICRQDFGIRNTSNQSPRELARKVAAANRVPVRDVTMLIMRYEEARYSDHKIAKKQYKEARQALHNLQLALENQPTSE